MNNGGLFAHLMETYAVSDGALVALSGAYEGISISIPHWVNYCAKLHYRSYF